MFLLVFAVERGAAFACNNACRGSTGDCHCTHESRRMSLLHAGECVHEQLCKCMLIYARACNHAEDRKGPW